MSGNIKLDEVTTQIEKAGNNPDDDEVQDETKKLVKDFRKQEQQNQKEEIQKEVADAKAHGADEDELEKVEADAKKETKSKMKDVNDALKDAAQTNDVKLP